MKAWLIGIWENPLGRALIFTGGSLVVFAVFFFYGLPEVWYALPISVMSSSWIGFFFSAKDVLYITRKSLLSLLEQADFVSFLSSPSRQLILDRIHQIEHSLPAVLPENNLYHFVQKHILVYLGKPYRRNFETRIGLHNREDYTEGEFHTKFEVHTFSDDEVTYRGEMKHTVNAVPGLEPGKHASSLSLRINGTTTLTGPTVRLDNNNKVLFSWPYTCPVRRDRPAKIEFSAMLKEYKRDYTEHQVFKDPTAGFKLHLSLEGFGECDFTHHFFGAVAPRQDQWNAFKSSFSIDYDGWMLPGNGFEVKYTPLESRPAKEVQIG